MEETQGNAEPEAEAFEAGYSDADQETINSLQTRHRARVLVPLLIVILVAIFLGWLGPVGENTVNTEGVPSEKSEP